MWSIYDTCILVSGLITAAIAVLPVKGIPPRTRGISAAVGGGLVLLSFLLGSLSSFSYPPLVVAGPIIAGLAAAAIVVQAVRGAGQPGALDGELGHAMPHAAASSAPVAPQAVAAPGIAAPDTATAAPVDPAADARVAAWAAVHDPATDATTLAALAHRYPEFGDAIERHPQAYDGLVAWLRANRAGGDPVATGEGTS
ncbi:hypothetical protein ACGGZK_05440 [Agromyces sp. MMS24-K17]|uniref:variant leucine-rich repeat-containing protein n=1 Tax=Agromyces sp. MMS24-K17 TaxID=3372850 RepID=UPI003753EE1C